ncbi:MAG: protease modulator HflC [Candidatus Sumerlaeota bacterium]|nr:protease modulator HflC [Candidatus Sumerlaeota bacterium]
MKSFFWTLIAVIAVGVLAWLSIFAVQEYESVMVTQFGRPVGAVIDKAGAHFKWPWQRLIRFDRRLRNFDPPPSEYLTQDKKNVVVDTFIVWRIREPQTFLAAAGDPVRCERNLQDFIASELSKQLGLMPLEALLTIQAEASRFDELSKELADACRDNAEQRFGIDLVDLRLKRLGFPQQNRQAVFDRMKEERKREAKAYRAAGEEEASKIRADADRQKAEILADAREESEKIKGEAEAQAIQIYSAAHNLDPEFYEFTRALDAYAKVLTDQATLIFSTDSRFFRILAQGAEALTFKTTKSAASQPAAADLPAPEGAGSR